MDYGKISFTDADLLHRFVTVEVERRHAFRPMPILPPLYDHKKPKNRRHDPFYDTERWRRLTKSHRQREPLCRECKKNGRVTAGTLTDHIIAILDGGDPWDEDNLQTLCDSCHQAKRAGEKR